MISLPSKQTDLAKKRPPTSPMKDTPASPPSLSQLHNKQQRTDTPGNSVKQFSFPSNNHMKHQVSNPDSAFMDVNFPIGINSPSSNRKQLVLCDFPGCVNRIPIDSVVNDHPCCRDCFQKIPRHYSEWFSEDIKVTPENVYEVVKIMEFEEERFLKFFPQLASTLSMQSQPLFTEEKSDDESVISALTFPMSEKVENNPLLDITEDRGQPVVNSYLLERPTLPIESELALTSGRSRKCDSVNTSTVCQ